MQNTKRFILILLAGVLVTGAALSSYLALPAGAAPWNFFQALPQTAAQPQASLVQESFKPNYWLVGRVELDYALPGLYSDPLPAPDPASSTLPDLGAIDLGFVLALSGSSLSGYVDLDHTLVFSREHTLDGSALGPAVSGSFDGTNLSLLSERVELVSAGERQRQFYVTGTVNSQAESRQLTGEYRETLWGYAAQPLTIVGSFTMELVQQPYAAVLYLPLVRR